MSLQVWLPLNGNLNNLGLNGNIVPTATNTTIISAGKTGSCYQFGTAISYITIPKEAMTSFTTEASVCFWFKIISWNTSYETYFQAGLGSTSWTHYIFGFLRNNTASTCCFTISNGSSASNASYLTPAFDLNKWYHIALVYKTGHCLIYIDGQLYQDYTTSIVPNFSGITTITTGICNNKSNYQTNCQMNDIRIYNHALSLKEVKEIAKGLVLHYKLDNNGLGNPNLLDNTNQGSNYWLQSYGNGAGSLTSDGIAAKYNITTQSTNWQVFAFKPSNNTTIMNNLSIAGKTYTLSFDIYSTSSFTTNPSYRDGNSQNNLITWPSFTTIANQWYHYEGSAITIGGTVSNQEIYINYKVPIGTYIFKNLKLEEGNKATPWSPYVNTNIIYDVSGYNRAATANAIAWSGPSPRYSTAAHLSLNSYITYSLPQNMYEATYSFWVKAPIYYSYGALNIPLGSPSGGTAPWFALNTEGYKVWAYFGGNSPHYTRGASGSLPTNEWHHCVYVWNNGVAQWYLDGVISGNSTTYTGKTYITNTAPSTIGDSYTGTSWSGTQFEGDVSDFRIYATALSADDIKELYNTSATIDKDGNIYGREFNTISSDFQITKTGIVTAVDKITEHDNKTAYIEKNKDIVGGQFYEY